MKTIQPQPGIRDLLEEITQDELQNHILALASHGSRHPEKPENLKRTLLHITGTLASQGYAVRKERYGVGIGDVNLFAEKVGAEHPEQVFELGAHFDTVPGSPGADDNGSGVAGVLAIAGLLSQVNLEKTVRLCIFGGEEECLLGSRHHVEHGLGDHPETLEGTVIFEMIGYRSREENSQRTPVRIPIVFSPPTTGDFITVVANWQSQSLATRFTQAANRYVPDLATFSVSPHGGLLKDASRSDHLPYWQTNRPAMMLTDTADFRNPHYHQPSDLPDTLDYEFLQHVTQATASMLLDWAILVA